MVNSLSSKKGYDVKSYGTGSVIKLPGAGPDEPNVYQFGTTYDEIYKDLTAKDPQLYPVFQIVLETCPFFVPKSQKAVANNKAASVVPKIGAVLLFVTC